jgi:putative (di)nucleoside polyphosphate hydrolase
MANPTLNSAINANKGSSLKGFIVPRTIGGLRSDHKRRVLWNNCLMSKQPADYIDKDGFRANVGIVLARSSGELFLGGRVGGRGWQFPQGGVNRGEQVDEALFRELKEEIGLERQDVEVLGSTRGWLRYRLPRQYVRDRCIGQKQRWFLLKLIADESKLRFDCTGTPEFDRWRWTDYWTPVREVVYFKRRVYVRALHDLGTVMFPEGLPPYPEWWPEIEALKGGIASTP